MTGEKAYHGRFLRTRIVETMIVIESFYKYRITFAMYVKRIYESWKLARHSE